MFDLWYYVEGKTDLSCITIPPTQTIHHLKTKIYDEAHSSFIGCDPMDLTLTKVRCIMNMNVNVDGAYYTRRLMWIKM